MARVRPAALAIALLVLGAPTDARAGPKEAEGRAAEERARAAERKAREQRQYRVTFGLGFSHWYGGTFGSPFGVLTPALTVGFVPLSWLELQVAHSMSVVELELPDSTKSVVGFETLGAILRRDLRIGTERLAFGAGFAGGVVHTRGGVRGAVGAVIVARWLVAVSRQLGVGPFADVRALLYELPEGATPLPENRDSREFLGHSDVHVQIGVMLAL